MLLHLIIISQRAFKLHITTEHSLAFSMFPLSLSSNFLNNLVYSQTTNTARKGISRNITYKRKLQFFALVAWPFFKMYCRSAKNINHNMEQQLPSTKTLHICIKISWSIRFFILIQHTGISLVWDFSCLESLHMDLAGIHTQVPMKGKFCTAQ